MSQLGSELRCLLSMDRDDSGICFILGERGCRDRASLMLNSLLDANGNELRLYSVFHPNNSTG